MGVYAVWIVRGLVALFIGAAGIAKLAGVKQLHQSFATLGLPVWFGYFIGVCEVLGALALFIDKVRPAAAVGIALIMVGAGYYHVRYTPIAQGLPALVIFLICLWMVAQSIKSTP